jgi:hypothetical protein
VSGDEVDDGGRSAAVGHVREVRAAHLGEELAVEMQVGAGAGGAVPHGLRLGARPGHERFGIVRRHRRVYRQRDAVIAGVRDGGEIR